MERAGACGCLVALVFAIFLFWLFYPFGSDDEVVSYMLFCNEPHEGTRCPGFEFGGNPTRHKVNRSRNEVVGLTLGSPTVLVNCDIFDAANWKCWYKDGSGPVEMTDGIQQDDGPRGRNARHWEYKIVKIKNFLSQF